jgi:hypothetical protein
MNERQKDSVPDRAAAMDNVLVLGVICTKTGRMAPSVVVLPDALPAGCDSETSRDSDARESLEFVSFFSDQKSFLPFVPLETDSERALLINEEFPFSNPNEKKGKPTKAPRSATRVRFLGIVPRRAVEQCSLI